jgi:hypothetical protein
MQGLCNQSQGRDIDKGEPGSSRQAEERQGINREIASVISHSPLVSHLLRVSLAGRTALWADEATDLLLEELSISVDVFVIYIAAVSTHPITLPVL